MDNGYRVVASTNRHASTRDVLELATLRYVLLAHSALCVYFFLQIF